MSPRPVRDILDRMEGANARIHGYGSVNSGRNLRHYYEHLVKREIREDELATVMGFAKRILECPMEVIPGVRETLEYLAGRHDLTLFTKGHVDEQKVDRSGWADSSSTRRSSKRRMRRRTGDWWRSGGWRRRTHG